MPVYEYMYRLSAYYKYHSSLLRLGRTNLLLLFAEIFIILQFLSRVSTQHTDARY